MTSLFPAVRAAEEFDSVLAGDADPRVADRHAGLLATVEILRAQPEVRPRAEFAADLRERLMLAAQTELAPAPGVASLATARASRATTARRSQRRRLGSVAASLVILGGTAGMAAAAAGALPGESLYPIKRGTEKLDAALRLSEASRGRVLLGQAETRLAEVGSLVEGGADPALVARTVDAFNAAADAGSDKLFVSYQREGDPADITAVREFTVEQMATLGEISAQSDPETGSALVEAADTLADIDQAALVLCSTCGPESPAAPPASLSAGAAVANLQSLLATPTVQVTMRLDTDGLDDLQRAAQEEAERTPAAPAAGAPAATPGDDDAQDSPGTITEDGRLVPGVGDGDTAVGDLVIGVTKASAEVPRTGVPQVDHSLDEAVEGVTGAVDDATDGLLP